MSLIEPDYACEAHIKVDNEIGGPGVAASFLFVSWLTIMLASILAVHELKLAIKRFRAWQAKQTRSRLEASNSAAPTTSPHSQNGTEPNTNNPLEDISDEATHPDMDPSGPNTPNLSPKLHKLIQLLGHICDIQVVTALAIIVAGLAQWNRISYYHEILVTQYFQLTLDSFWAARINYMDFYQIDHVHDNLTIPTHSLTSGSGPDSMPHSNNHHQARTPKPPNVTGTSYYDDRQSRLQVRRAAVLCACILAIIWQFRLYFRENVGPYHWNEGPAGPCYRYLDRSNPVAVLVVRTTGLIVFCFALGVTLLGYPLAGKVHGGYEWLRSTGMSWARGRFSKWLGRYDLLTAGTYGRGVKGMESTSEKHMQASSHDSSTALSTGHFNSKTTERKGTLKRLAEWTLTLTMLSINGFILLVVFLISQWLAIWTYGDGFYPLLWFCYFCFNVWNTVSVISLLILNHPLVDHEEFDLGFGQVLPIVRPGTLVVIVINLHGAAARAVQPRLPPWGSVTRPSLWCGLFGLRPTKGSVSIEGIEPFCQVWDTAGILEKDLQKCRDFAARWLSPEFLVKPHADRSFSEIIWPADFWEIIDGQQVELAVEFTAKIGASLGLASREVSFRDAWTRKPPPEAAGLSLQDYIVDANKSQCYDAYHNCHEFRVKYRDQFGTAAPYVSPGISDMWSFAKNMSKEQRDMGFARLAVYKRWFNDVVVSGSGGGGNPLIIMPLESMIPRYRDEAPSFKRPPQDGVNTLALAAVLGSPALAVPVAEIPYYSRITEQEEKLPFVVAIMSGPGTDLVLMDTVQEALVRNGLSTRVETGKTMFIDKSA